MRTNMFSQQQSKTFIKDLVKTDETPQPRRIAASVIGLSKRFGTTRVLENINFDVAEGETLVLLGASGSGKTTILRTIAGLEQPDTGHVILHGKDVTNLPARERGVGVIFQSYALFPKMTVEQNIGYGLRIRRRNRKEIRTAVGHLLELVRLKEHRQKYPGQLSGGQQQRVAIARTLAYQPEVLLFDEPFGALDAQTRTRLRSEIRTLLRKVRVPAIFITHDQEEALELGDRIAVINDGHIEQIGTPREVYDQSATEYVASFLGRANMLQGIIRQGNVQVGSTLLPLLKERQKVREGQAVSLVFRPEDVRLTKELLPSDLCLSFTGTVEEVSFMGAYERLYVRLDLSRNASDRFSLSTIKPKHDLAQRILVTRLKPEPSAQRLNPGDEVLVGLVNFTVLPKVKSPGFGIERVLSISQKYEFSSLEQSSNRVNGVSRGREFCCVSETIRN
jgi:ABC-type Fe3+/spermidine/putrescine transport system ATPase subunit